MHEKTRHTPAKSWLQRALYLLMIAGLLAAFTACQPAQEEETAGEKIEETAEETGDAIEDAADEVEDAMDDGSDNVGEAVEEAGDEVEDTIEDATDELDEGGGGGGR